MIRELAKYLPAPIIIGLALATLFATAHAQRAANSLRPVPVDVVKAYLRATQARDWRTAYRYISSVVDGGVRDEQTFLRSQERFDGFALDLARDWRRDMKVWIIEKKLGPTKAHLEVGYRLPTGDEISPQLFDWNPDKLNALSASEQRRLFEAIDGLRNRPQRITIEGAGNIRSGAAKRRLENLF